MRWLTGLAFTILAPLVGAIYVAQDQNGLAAKVAPELAPWLEKIRTSAIGFAESIKTAPAPYAATHYLTSPVEKGDIRKIVTVSGKLNAVGTVDVGSQLSGQIARLFVNFNDAVTKGQPLAQLDRQSFEQRVAEAKAAVEMAKAAIEIQKAKVERARIDAQDTEAQRAVLQARTEKAQITLKAKEIAVPRMRRLSKKGASSGASLEDAVDARDSAAAALREAEAIERAHTHKVAGAKLDLEREEAELVKAIANLPQKQAQLRLAEIDLERTTIRSPVSGIVVGRKVNAGQTVAASFEAPTLFTIAGDLRDMQIEARVDETDIGQIEVGQKATFTVGAFPGKSFPAVVAEIRKAPEVQQNVVAYTVVLSTTNTDGLLLPGMTAVVRIVTHETGTVLTVPLAALRFSPQEGDVQVAAVSQLAQGGSPLWGLRQRTERTARVWLLGTNGRPRAVTVGLGKDDGSRVAVLSGPINEGEAVIVNEIPPESSNRLFGIKIGF
jgi:HlyD family secretion protein